MGQGPLPGFRPEPAREYVIRWKPETIEQAHIVRNLDDPERCQAACAKLERLLSNGQQVVLSTGLGWYRLPPGSFFQFRREYTEVTTFGDTTRQFLTGTPHLWVNGVEIAADVTIHWFETFDTAAVFVGTGIHFETFGAFVEAHALDDPFRRTLEAEKRAWELLCESLTPAQLAMWNARMMFEVVGSKTGKTYTIAKHYSHNITAPDDSTYCLVFDHHERLPLGDQLIAQKLWIETDEPAFLKTAVHSPRRPFGY